MKLILLIFLISFCETAISQKMNIDSAAIKKWYYVANWGVAISNNGDFVSYTIENYPEGNHTLVITNSNGTWKKEFVGAEPCTFSGDDKYGIFAKKDSIFFLTLGTDLITYLTHILIYKWPPSNTNGKLAYKLNLDSQSLIILNTITGEKNKIDSVVNFYFSDSGTSMLIERKMHQDSIDRIAIYWMNLITNKKKLIWPVSNLSASKAKINSYSFDKSGNQVVFLLQANDTLANSIWYFNSSFDKAILKVKENVSEIDSGYLITGPLSFSQNSRWIFFSVEKPKIEPSITSAISKVDIWSYKDLLLQPEQARRIKSNSRLYHYAISPFNEKIVRLEFKDERLLTSPQEVTGDYVILADNSVSDYWWQIISQPTFFILSLRDGDKIVIQKENHYLTTFSFSPFGKYLTYYNWKCECYFSFDLFLKQIHNISKSIPFPISKEKPNGVIHLPVYPIAGWLEKDTALIMYDNYDIWQVNPKNTTAPINITNGYGRKQHIKFRLVYEIDNRNPIVIIPNNKPILISAFNPVTKYNGFYSIHLDEKRNPKILTLKSCTFYHKESQLPSDYEFSDNFKPLKARNVDAWIVKHETAEDPPNYFFTRDFIDYRAISNVQPQSPYNWLTTKLLKWHQLDGSPSEGILYKPENFDPAKKYPLIFNYYEQLSYRLYEFPEPGFTEDNINIPWFVSNGYLVFTPDIHYLPANVSGKTVGQWAYNSIVSAAHYLSKYPFIDGSKMAIQGHSFGGLETNYLVTHTHIFAAAAEAAGSSDPISAYLTLIPFVSSIEHFDKQSIIENGHELYGATPWQRPDLYRINSAVLNADKVTTPLLIMHNKNDNQVQWRQGIELYMALRRLTKKVWMLQYEEGDHGVSGKDAIDYTTRLTQFFNYYLKNTLPPKWMTIGISPESKKIDTGYQLDSSGKIP